MGDVILENPVFFLQKKRVGVLCATDVVRTDTVFEVSADQVWEEGKNRLYVNRQSIIKLFVFLPQTNSAFIQKNQSGSQILQLKC